jgi:hypothetical protein
MAQTLEPGVSRRSPLDVAYYPQSSRLRGLHEFATSRRGQLALALGVALALRIVLLVRAQGMLEGDEAVLGIQAEDILRGAHPIYFYGQPYMASWDAYLLAPLQAVVGPSGTLLHVVTLGESLLLIPLLGMLATKLYGRRAWLPALLVAAVPPLYVVVGELHFWGGYVETLVVGTGLLLVVVSIAERWAQAAPTWRLWGLAGLLIGLGCWIDPLILCYVAAGALWLAPLAVLRLLRSRAERLGRSAGRLGRSAGRLGRSAGRAAGRGALRSASLALLGGLVGAFPAVLYALQNHFTNLTYFLPAQTGGQSNYARAHPWRIEVLKDAFSQTIPRVAGMRTVWDATSSAHKVNIVVGLLIAVLTLAAVGYGGVQIVRLVRLVGAAAAARVAGQRDARTRAQQASLPLRAQWRYALAPLLAGVILLMFWRSSFTDALVIYPAIDVAGRYALPLETALVLLFACLFANLPILLRRAARGRWGSVGGRVAIEHLVVRPFAGGRYGVGVLASRVTWALLVLLLALYAVPYADSNMVNAFQTPYRGTVDFHTRQAEVLAYVEQQHIHYLWSVHWIGNVMMYLDNEHVICVDYVALAVGHDRDRFPHASAAIAHADRPSFLIEADPTQGEPAVLLAFQDLGVRYTWKEFGPMWIVTPTSRTVQPAEIQWALVLDY